MSQCDSWLPFSIRLCQEANTLPIWLEKSEGGRGNIGKPKGSITPSIQNTTSRYHHLDFLEIILHLNIGFLILQSGGGQKR